MTLPGILAPAGTPAFLVDNHSIDEQGLYASLKFKLGHSRTRRVRTSAERVVSVSWLLEPDELAAVDDWFEVTLRAGSRQFAARVANQDGSGTVYWAARWISFEVELLALGRGLVRGSLFLTGTPSATPPDTSTLASEGTLALLCVPANPTIGAALASEGTLALKPLRGLASEGTLALTVPVVDALLLETGDFLLLESGDRILLES